MIMMAPFLLMILHFSQMGFTEDLTFISKYTPFLKKSPYTIVTERFANCKHYFKENARFFKGFLCHFYIMAFCLRNARAECGCRRQHLPLARVCILPEGHFCFTGNPEGISRKAKKQPFRFKRNDCLCFYSVTFPETAVSRKVCLKAFPLVSSFGSPVKSPFTATVFPSPS